MSANAVVAPATQLARADRGSLELSVLKVPEGLGRWNLVADFLRLRNEVFINRLAWPLYARDGLEFEQYDTVTAIYVVAHVGDHVIGGARLLPTTHRVGQGTYVYSYMIRDACRNILPGLPQDLCDEEPPSDARTWELTRLATLGDSRVGGEVLFAANQFLRSRSASRCLFLASPTFMRMAKRLGFTPEALGGVKTNAEGSFLAFSCQVI